MSRITMCLLAGALIASGAAIGKLPPPTADEQAAVAAKKAKEQEQLEKEKALLEKAQDRVVARYRKDNGSKAASGGKASDQNMPKTTSELPGGVGPKPERPPSGEAHSAPAK
jgi:phosphoenolpyruvate-protein kinase (PTS system EI component)